MGVSVSETKPETTIGDMIVTRKLVQQPSQDASP